MSLQKVPPVETKPVQPRSSDHSGKRRRRSGWQHRLRRRLQRIRWGKVLLVLIALIAVAGVTTVAVLVDSANRVQASITSFQRVVTALGERTGTEMTMIDFERLDSSVGDLSGSLAAIRSRLTLVKPFASLNADLHTTLTSIDAAYSLTLATDNILSGLQPTLFFLVSGNDTQAVVTQISSGERIVELLQVGRGQFVSAERHLSGAAAALATLDLNGVSSEIVLNVQELNRYLEQLTQVNGILMNAPDFLTGALGISGSKNYLVLSQNNDELRPSGGYISTYGWVTVRNGRITGYDYSPTTTTSPNPPSVGFAEQLSIPDWWLRYREPVYAAWDGSWHADFPSTARMAIDFYNAGNNPQSPVDGTIAIDITGFEYLLEVIGEVTVPGYAVRANAENFRAVVYDLRVSDYDDLAHKQFIAALYHEIFTEWQNTSLDSAKNTLILQAVLRGLQEKHIMLYFNDQRLNDALDLLGWSGAQIPASNHDYLMVVDANLGNKSNHSVIRSLTYDVDLQSDGTVHGRATIAYDYSEHIAAEDPAVNPPYNGPVDYNNLLQVFVPLGSTLTDVTNLTSPPTVASSALATEFISRLFVRFDSSERFQFTYQTPSLIENVGSYRRYRLLLQKQPGTPANAVSVQVMLPEDARFVSSTPLAAASYNLDRPILEYRTDLTIDRWIEIIYQ